MSDTNSTRRFCPRCEADTERRQRGQCKGCAARRQAKYRAANPDKVKAGIDAWRAANPSKARAASTSWNEANPVKVRANVAKWKREHPDSVRGWNANRRARVGGDKLSPGLTEKLFGLQKGRCACCREPLGRDYHLDHIMPLSRGGRNVDENMQLLRGSCNRQKYAKHPVDYMQSKGYLL